MQYNKDLSILSQVAAKAAADVTVATINQSGIKVDDQDVAGLFTEIANGIRSWLIDASLLKDDDEAEQVVMEAFVGQHGSAPQPVADGGSDNVVQLPQPAGFTTCPRCGGGVYDNRSTNQTRKSQGKKAMPAFKCKNQDGCGWVEWGPKDAA